MYFFYWFGKAKSAFIAMCILGGVTGLSLLGGLICFAFNPAMVETLLFISLVPAVFTLLYLINWLSCRRRDRKYGQATQPYGPLQAYQAPQPGQVPPQGYYPTPGVQQPQVYPTQQQPYAPAQQPGQVPPQGYYPVPGV